MSNNSIVFNEEKLKIAQDLLDEIKTDLTDIDNSLFDAVTKLSNTTGFDLVEVDNTAIDMRMPEKLMIQCEEDTKFISDTLNNQIQAILSYIGDKSISSEVGIDTKTKEEAVSGVTAEQGESKILIKDKDGNFIEVTEEEARRLASNKNHNTTPATTTPATTTPVTAAPTTVPTTPATTTPVTTTPATTTPVTTVPVTQAPTTVPRTFPTNPETVPSEPATTTPKTEPATTTPATTQPATTTPATTQPATTTPVTTTPATTQPATTTPVTTTPATTQPATTSPLQGDDLGTIVISNTTVPTSTPTNPITAIDVTDTTPIIQERVTDTDPVGLTQHVSPNTSPDDYSTTEDSTIEYSSIPETGVGMKDKYGDYLTPAAIGAAAGIAGMIAAKAMHNKKDKEEENEE